VSGIERSIPVFYCEQLLANSQSFSPSAGKPRQVVANWQAAGLPISLPPFSPVTVEELSLSHDPGYVRGVLDATLPNGFGNELPEVAHSLPWTTGSMLAAAKEALLSGVACAPVSGFHHAHYDSGGGYCTFNGLTVTAAKLLAEGLAQRVMILDCDQHFGDGTEQIIEQLSLGRSVENVSFGRWFHEPAHASAYLARLREIVARLSDFDLVLYQAGADVHVDDPLGGVLTTEQMVLRDRIVFEAARRHAIPLAWNLTGGYQDPIERVLALHLNTMRACVGAYCDSAAVRRPLSPPRQTDVE
jgi:acetoin utilization deacetylase AcuC-like enzyme